MKFFGTACLFGHIISGVAVAAPSEPPAEPHFVSAVQLVVHEATPELIRRGQSLVIKELNDSMETWPELQGLPFEVKTSGNEVVFFMNSRRDMRPKMQEVVGVMIDHLNGSVPTHGRFLSYRASLDNPSDALLEVVGDPSRTRIRSIYAQSVPLRDVLKEIKNRLSGVSMSYSIPGDCAARVVDWNFGNALEPNGKDVDSIMSEIAAVFDLQYVKKKGNYNFKSDCSQPPKPMRIAAPNQFAPQGDFVRARFLPGNPASRHPHVYVPLLPLGN